MSSSPGSSDDPRYDALPEYEPPELRCIERCGCTAWAVVLCQRCDRAYCCSCGSAAHSARTDAAEHWDSCVQLSMCHEPNCFRSAQFYCFDCERLQCELCYSCAHQNCGSNSEHGYYTIESRQACSTPVLMDTDNLCLGEGAPSRLFQHSAWGAAFVEGVRMKRWKMLQELADNATPSKEQQIDQTHSHAPVEDDVETSDEVMDWNAYNLQIQSEKREDIGTEVEIPASESSPAIAEAEQSSVHLPTQNSDDSEITSDEDAINSDSQPNTESSGEWWSGTLVHLTDEDGDVGIGCSSQFTSGWASEVGPIVDGLVQLYSAKNDEMVVIEKQIKATTAQSQQAPSYSQMSQCLQQLKRLEDAWTKVNADRQASVARLLVTQFKSPSEITAMLDSHTADIPDAEAPIHRQCMFAASKIKALRESLERCKYEIEQAILLKGSGANEDLCRLSDASRQMKMETHALETKRLDALRSMLLVSSSLRAAVRAMLD